MGNFFGRLLRKVGKALTADIRSDLAMVRDEIITTKKILIDSYIQRNLFENPKYANVKNIARSGHQVYSQNDEDGIIQEIFQRIGTTNKFFVEFGVDDGLECNSLSLLLQGWKGCWLDAGEDCIKRARERFRLLVEEKLLLLKQSFITAENIEELFQSMAIPKEFDLLSIDIDGNDYWIWNAIDKYSPRVIVIEYNSMFKPPMEFIVKYEPTGHFPIASHFGASLKSVELLGSKKGYKLVGCNFTGVNAFFVREDLARDRFLEPFTAETHYEPPKYFLLNKGGHPRSFERFENDFITSKPARE